MNRVEYYRWRTLWAGKWGTTRYVTTEEDIRKSNPEAIRIDSSLVVRMVPETQEERDKLMTAGSLHSGRFKP